jgi:hypothetical protein
MFEDTTYMAKLNSLITTARKEGYGDDEILDYLKNL